MRPRRPHKPIPFYSVRRRFLLCWQWSITDGPAGPYMVVPHHAPTQMSAYRRATKALRRLEVQGLA